MTKVIMNRYLRDKVWQPTLKKLQELADGRMIERYEEESDADGLSRRIRLWMHGKNQEGPKLEIQLQVRVSRLDP